MSRRWITLEWDEWTAQQDLLTAIKMLVRHPLKPPIDHGDLTDAYKSIRAIFYPTDGEDP